jgi:hypothetical protein
MIDEMLEELSFAIPGVTVPVIMLLAIVWN